MNLKIKSRVLLITAILILISILPLMACKPQPARIIKIGMDQDLTGPTSESGRFLLKGAQDYIKYVNQEKGGLKGIKLELLWADNGYSVPRTISIYQRFKEQGIVAFYNQTSAGLFAIKPLAERDSIPILTESADLPTMYPSEGIFAITQSLRQF